MKGKRWIAVALVCLAGVGIGGCSIFTGAPGDVREESETMGEDGLVVPSASSQETEESSQTKPTKTEPESIPPFRMQNGKRKQNRWRMESELS